MHGLDMELTQKEAENQISEASWSFLLCQANSIDPNLLSTS